MEGREERRNEKALAVLTFLLDPNQQSPASGPERCMQIKELEPGSKKNKRRLQTLQKASKKKKCILKTTNDVMVDNYKAWIFLKIL